MRLAQASQRRRTESQQGLTLLETAMALAIGSVVMLALGRVLTGTTSSMSYLVQEAVAVEDVQGTVQRLSDEMRTSDPELVSIVTGTMSDSVTFQSVQAGVAGVEDADGAFQPNWSLRYLTSGSDLLRQALDSGGTVRESAIAVRDLDLTSASVKGFSVTRNGSLYVLRVRVTKDLADGNSVTRSAQSAVFVP